MNLSIIPAPEEHFYGHISQFEPLVATIVDAVLAAPSRDDAKIVGEAVNDALAGELNYFYRCQQCGAQVFPDEDPPLAYVLVD